MYAGRANADSGVLQVAEAARSAPLAAQPPRSMDLILDGLAHRCTEGPSAGVPVLMVALQEVRNETLDDHAQIMRWLLLTPIVQSMTVFELWDDDAFHALATRAVQLARDTGALALLPVALVYRSGVHLFGGELAAAEALVQEADAISVATGNTGLLYASLLVGAWRGVEADAAELIDAGLDDVRYRGQGCGAGRLCHRGAQQRLGSVRSSHGRCQGEPATTATSDTRVRHCQSLSRRQLVAVGRTSLPLRCRGWRS